MSVGENIRRMRNDRRLSQDDLANSVGVSQAMIAQVERGVRNPSLQVGKEIADVLGCTMEQLLE